MEEEKFKVHEDLFKNTITLPYKQEGLSDTGSSSVVRYDYTQGLSSLDSIALISRYDQQIIRTLSSNMS